MAVLPNGHYSNLRACFFGPDFPSCTALEKRQSIEGCAGFKATSSEDGQRRTGCAKRSLIDCRVFLVGTGVDISSLFEFADCELENGLLRLTRLAFGWRIVAHGHYSAMRLECCDLNNFHMLGSGLIHSGFQLIPRMRRYSDLRLSVRTLRNNPSEFDKLAPLLQPKANSSGNNRPRV